MAILVSHKSADLLVESSFLRHFLKHDVFSFQEIIKCPLLVVSGTSLFIYKDDKIALRILIKIGTKLSAWASETWILVTNLMTFLCNINISSVTIIPRVSVISNKITY